MMTNDMAISIILVNWNGMKWMEKLLSSVTKQTYKNYEVIFVDNGSTDDSVAFVRKNYPQVKVIEHGVNSGFAAGNNVGIKSAKTPLILMLNTDTWIEPDFLEKLLAFGVKTGYDIVGPREASYDGKEFRPAYSTTLDPLGHPLYSYDKVYNAKKNMYLSGVCILFKKELYLETGGMDENFFMYFEEVDWFWRMVLAGKTFSYADDIYVFHAGAGSGAGGINYKSFLWRNENTLQMLLKNYSWGSLIVVLPLYFAQNILEIIAFVILGKIHIAKSYIQGWVFNAKNFKRTMGTRRIVQQNRKYGDIHVFGKMFIGLAKLKHIARFISKRISKNA